jgi:uncharacterized protein YutE (UPF0331/DUF86 family)
MTQAKINGDIVSQRALWVRRMIVSLEALPRDKTKFLSHPNNVAAAESYLRRALEALFDLSRHILAKKFAYPTAEYKEIAEGLLEKKVIKKKERDLLRRMAGYRNRMVHFYHEITPEELYDICRHQLDDISALLDTILKRMNHTRK